MVNYGKIDEAHDLSKISETALTILFPALRERVGIVFEKISGTEYREKLSGSIFSTFTIILP